MHDFGWCDKVRRLQGSFGQLGFWNQSILFQLLESLVFSEGMAAIEP